MSKLSDRLETELDEDEQLASLRVQYTFEEQGDLEGAGSYYRATKRSGEGEVAVRFFDLQGTAGLQGLDATQTIKRRPVASDDEPASESIEANEGLGEVSNSIQDPEADSIDAAISSARGDEDSEAETLSFERADIESDDLLSRLSHPNLVKVEGYRRGKRTLAVVTDEIDGHALSQHVYDGALRGKPDRAAVVARDLARALGYIHERGVLHLDIKPENVLRDSTGEVRLLNVGVVPLIEKEFGEDEIRGTPEYVAPERIDVDDGRVGPWTDLYSLGVLLYHAATGRAPFSGADTDELVESHLHETPPAPRSINSKISPFLERVVMRLLAKDPADRYRAADELEWDLDKYLEQAPSERFDVRREPRVWDTGLSSVGGVFFGRGDEMDRLTKHLTVEADRPRVALVRGSRGVGKSALLENQIERLERQELGPVYARAAGDLDSVAAVVMLARGAVRQILESHQFDTEAWRNHFRDASPAAQTLVGRVPRLGRLLPDRQEAPSPSDDNRRALMRNVIAWRDLFELLLTGPDDFTWIVDDLHRLGELSGEILAEFVHRRDDLVSRWLLSQTPGENPNGDEWIEENVVGSESEVEILGLEALEREQLRTYFGDLLHAGEDVLDRFADRVMGVSGGRPEMIQVALQQLTESGAIAFRAGKLRIDEAKLEEIRLAEGLVEYALEAWSEFESGERDLAYNVALVGDCIPAALLAEVASVPRDGFEDQLAALVTRRILEVTPVTHARLVSCTEDTVREFVRKQLTPSEFERRHRMLAFEFTDFYELVDDDRFDDGWLCVNIAQQWVAAGEPDRAVDWLARGGQIRLTEGRVLNALELLREGELRADDPFEIRADGLSMVELLGDALAAAGDGEEAVERYEQALEQSRDFDERQRLRLKLGRGLQQRQAYDRSYDTVAQYLEERGIEVPETEERLALAVVWLVIKYFAMRAMFRLGIYSPVDADDAEVTRELDNFEAAQLLNYNLRQHNNWFPLLWLSLSTENRSHRLRDSRTLAVNSMGHARLCTQLPKPMPGRAASFRDLALEQVDLCDDDRVRSYVGAGATKVSFQLGDHESAVEYAREFRPVTVSEGAFSDYQDILESLIHLTLYAGNLSAADQLVNRFVADARAFGTYEVAHLTNYFEAYVEFLRGDYAEARKHLGQSRSANQRAQDATCVAMQDWLDFELLWRYGQRREALATARKAVDSIEGRLRADALTETICRAARLASRAALEAREGNIQEDPWELLQFADRCCAIAVDRTDAFPTLRAMVRCEQGRLAWVRDEREEAVGRLDQSVVAAETFGQVRFQAAAYEVRGLVKAQDRPLHALADARRSRALYELCGFSEAVDRVDEDIEDLLETRPNLEAFSQGFGIRSPEAAELEPTEKIEDTRNPFRTIELSPEAEEVEVVATEETLRPWEGEDSGLAALVPPSPEGSGDREAPAREEAPAEPPVFEMPEEVEELDSAAELEESGDDTQANERAEADELPMPPSPDKPASIREESDAEEVGSVLPSPSAAEGEKSEDTADVAEDDEEDARPPTLPNVDNPEVEAVEPEDVDERGDAEDTAVVGGPGAGNEEGSSSDGENEARATSDASDEDGDDAPEPPGLPEGVATREGEAEDEWKQQQTKKGVARPGDLDEEDQSDSVEDGGEERAGEGAAETDEAS